MDASVSSDVLYSLPSVGLTMHMPRGFLSGNKERDKAMPEKVMEKMEKEEKMEEEIRDVFKTMQKVNQSWYETYQIAAQSTFDIQGRAVQYAQSVFVDGVETLKSHIDASQRWFQTANKSQNQQESIPFLVENSIEAYKRNAIFLQRTFDHGSETVKRNTEVMRDLTQTLLKKAQERQEMLWS